MVPTLSLVRVTRTFSCNICQAFPSHHWVLLSSHRLWLEMWWCTGNFVFETSVWPVLWMLFFGISSVKDCLGCLLLSPSVWAVLSKDCLVCLLPRTVQAVFWHGLFGLSSVKDCNNELSSSVIVCLDAVFQAVFLCHGLIGLSWCCFSGCLFLSWMLFP